MTFPLAPSPAERWWARPVTAQPPVAQPRGRPRRRRAHGRSCAPARGWARRLGLGQRDRAVAVFVDPASSVLTWCSLIATSRRGRSRSPPMKASSRSALASDGSGAKTIRRLSRGAGHRGDQLGAVERAVAVAVPRAEARRPRGPAVRRGSGFRRRRCRSPRSRSRAAVRVGPPIGSAWPSSAQRGGASWAAARRRRKAARGGGGGHSAESGTSLLPLSLT